MVKPGTPENPDAEYGLKTQVRLQESPPRVYVDFVDTGRGRDTRVKIARAGSPDNQHLMWLYTNGTQRVGARGPQTGRLGFRQQYIGTGQFEARLFVDGNLEQAVQRIAFTVSSTGGSTTTASDPITTRVSARTPVKVAPVVAAAEPVYGLQAQVRTQETPARVYVDFADTGMGVDTRVKIARAGSPDDQHLMWLYTNGTQQITGEGAQTGRLGFRQQYIGTGQFEARLFVDGNLNEAVRRIPFSIP